MNISMIAAVAANGIIGKNNDLAWQLPDDMKFFQEKTKGHHVIMGRKNYESLPDKYRPLPDRTNIVITRQQNFEAEGCMVVHTMGRALAICKGNEEEEAFIIGGGEIYRLGFSYANILYITEIQQEYDGDTYFPMFNKAEWKEVERIHHPADKRHEAAFDFVKYVKEF